MPDEIEHRRVNFRLAKWFKSDLSSEVWLVVSDFDKGPLLKVCQLDSNWDSQTSSQFSHWYHWKNLLVIIENLPENRFQEDQSEIKSEGKIKRDSIRSFECSQMAKTRSNCFLCINTQKHWSVAGFADDKEVMQFASFSSKVPSKVWSGEV